MHVTFDESNPSKEDIVLCDDDDDIVEVPLIDTSSGNNGDQPKHQDEKKTNDNDLPKEWRTHRDHPIDKVIGDISQGVATRLNLKDACLNMDFVSQIEPSKVDEALGDDQWIIAMQEELNQFKRNQVWELVPRPSDKHIIGTAKNPSLGEAHASSFAPASLDGFATGIARWKLASGSPSDSLGARLASTSLHHSPSEYADECFLSWFLCQLSCVFVFYSFMPNSCTITHKLRVIARLGESRMGYKLQVHSSIA
ncbi:hypothetical protein KIW84_045360 [Lathyrus oleraceus]|uniref:Uncharacterized protein n=1 Tax=Pisum sativum TaxID=3888 RepID=A0A9D5AU38_PEA|nr:hypothetical protein KIW84_045360 [Pisum sativum]